MGVREVFVLGLVLALYMGTSYWVFTDVLRLPRMLNLHPAEVKRDIAGTGAIGWLVGCLVVWPLALPSYLIYRGALIRTHRMRYDAFHRMITDKGLSAYLRRQALINGIYLVAVAFIPQMIWWTHGTGRAVAFLFDTGAWAGWALFGSGLVILAVLATERGLSAPLRRRMAQALMPGFPLLIFSIIVAVFAADHLSHILGLISAHQGASQDASGFWSLLITYGWALLLWMVPAVAVVNMITEAFAPGVASVVQAIRAIWREEPTCSVKVPRG